MMRLFCRQNHYPFGSVLKIGSGEAILDSPFRFLTVRKIRRFAGSIAKGSYGTFQTTMPLPKGLFVKAAVSYWNNYGKKIRRYQRGDADHANRIVTPDLTEC